MNGRIVRGVGGLYYVSYNGAIYECQPRGIFRLRNIKPLVGDLVDIEILDETERKGYIRDVLPRKCELLRPAAANVDRVVVTTAFTKPQPDTVYMDKLLMTAENLGIVPIICFTKSDLTDERDLPNVYRDVGYDVFSVSVVSGDLDGLYDELKGKLSVLAGQSGVGKSSLVNYLSSLYGIDGGYQMETGELSKKISRGKQTTRHAQLIGLADDTFIIDTPGFAVYEVDDDVYYREFEEYIGKCRFNDCKHMNEPDCAVKEQVGKKIQALRYGNYIKMMQGI
jgi:ribosome biogenesis GTPase